MELCAALLETPHRGTHVVQSRRPRETPRVTKRFSSFVAFEWTLVPLAVVLLSPLASPSARISQAAVPAGRLRRVSWHILSRPRAVKRFAMRCRLSLRNETLRKQRSQTEEWGGSPRSAVYFCDETKVRLAEEVWDSSLSGHR